MSTPPPPLPPGPPQPRPPQPGLQPPGYQQPGYQQPGYQQAPAWQAQPGFLNQPAPPKKRSKAPILIVAIVLLVGAGVAAFLVLGGDDKKSAAVDAAGAHDGLQTVLRDASFDDTGNDDFSSCPLGDLDELNGLVTKVLEIDDVVFDGDENMGAVDEDGSLPAYVSCQVFASDEGDVARGATGVFYQSVFEPPSNYEKYIKDFSGDVTDLTFEDSQEYLGGEIVIFCAEATSDEGFTGCDADWVSADENVALAVFLGGTDINSDDAVTALKAVLPAMADNLAAQASTES
jgi:hypothetical protein